MRVDDLRQEKQGEWTSISARITWEETDRPPARISIQVGSSLERDLECHPNAFLVATAVPASYYGERRLAIEGKVCPVLRDGVLSVWTQHKEWYDPQRVLPAIEATRGFASENPRTPGRAGQLFSGGVDALATLRRNRLMYRPDHPSSIRDCLHVFGMHPMDYRGGELRPDRYTFWQQTLGNIRRIAEAADVELHLIRTNAHGVFEDLHLQANEYHSASLLSLGHLLTRRINELSIAASDYIGDLFPWGSHPSIDPYYSSSSLRVHHDGTRLTRLDKVRLIAEWPEALSLLNVCVNWSAPETSANCGTCDKCVRTMLELLVCERLHQTPTFLVDDVDPALLSTIKIRTQGVAGPFIELMEPLQAMGRNDLVSAIQRRLDEYQAWKQRRNGRGLKPKIKKLDEQLLGGWIQRTWKERKKSRV